MSDETTTGTWATGKAEAARRFGKAVKQTGKPADEAAPDADDTDHQTLSDWEQGKLAARQMFGTPATTTTKHVVRAKPEQISGQAVGRAEARRRFGTPTKKA